MPRFNEASGAEKQVDVLPPLSPKKKALLPLELALGSLRTSEGFPPQLQGLKGATELFEHVSVIMKMLFITCYHGKLICPVFSGRECLTLEHSCMSWKLCGQNQGLHRVPSVDRVPSEDGSGGP